MARGVRHDDDSDDDDDDDDDDDMASASPSREGYVYNYVVVW